MPFNQAECRPVLSSQLLRAFLYFLELQVLLEKVLNFTSQEKSVRSGGFWKVLTVVFRKVVQSKRYTDSDMKQIRNFSVLHCLITYFQQVTEAKRSEIKYMAVLQEQAAHFPIQAQQGWFSQLNTPHAIVLVSKARQMGMHCSVQ